MLVIYLGVTCVASQEEARYGCCSPLDQVGLTERRACYLRLALFVSGSSQIMFVVVGMVAAAAVAQQIAS